MFERCATVFLLKYAQECKFSAFPIEENRSVVALQTVEGGSQAAVLCKGESFELIRSESPIQSPIYISFIAR